MPTTELMEKASAQYTATLKDQNTTPIPGGNLTSLTLTLYDVTTGTILNSRNAQDVLNKNNVTVDGNGLLTWLVQPADTAIVDPSRLGETHCALWTFVYNGWTGRHRVEMYVRNLTKVS